MKINCIIIDDEQPARDELAYLLSEYNEINILDQVDSASKAVKSIKKNQPHFIFLDIQMPEKSGFEVISEIKKMETPPLVVFVTAYDQYAVKAFEKNAIDYIMKPFSQSRLEKSLNRVKDVLNLKNDQLIQRELKNLIKKTDGLKRIKKVSVEYKGRLLLLNPEDIIFCKYMNKKISMHTKDKIYTLYGIHTLDRLQQYLDSNAFFRSHRNTILNFNHIKELSPWFHGKYYLTMTDENKTELIVPRNRVKLFKQALGI